MTKLEFYPKQEYPFKMKGKKKTDISRKHKLRKSPPQNHTKIIIIRSALGGRSMILHIKSEMHEGMKSSGKGKYMDNSKITLIV